MTTTLLARNTDPISSKLAAKTAKVSLAETLLLEFAERSLTAEEAAERANLLGTGYWKRVSDLVRDGLLVERTIPNQPAEGPVVTSSDLRYVMMRKNQSGKHAIVWKITMKGRAEVRSIKARLKG